MKFPSCFILIIVIIITFIFSIFTASAQDKTSKFQLSFVPPLSTNGSQAPQYSNDYSVNILVGISQNENKLAVAGLGNVMLNNANGVQLSGLFNYTGNEANGMQIAGFANITRGSVNGLQLSGFLNTSREMNGFQLGGGINIASEMNGFQIGGLVNVAREMNGFQIAGLANVAAETSGFQLAGLGNIADNVSGSQISGIFNKAKKVSGFQLAALVNIAESSEYPIGILNLIKDGEMAVGVSYNELGSTVATFRSGSSKTYGILGVGYNHKASSGQAFVTEAGIGVHINCLSWMRINTEAKGGTIGDFSKKSTYYSNLAILPAFKLAPKFELFGGPSINYLHTDRVENMDLFPNHSIWKKYGSSKLQQVYLGYQVGLQYTF